MSIETLHLFMHLFFFVLGTIIGSFLNVVVLRHEKGEGVDGRSYCPTCHKTLRWYELMPVVSYLLQQGKCRGCAAHISVQYPLVEFVTGLIFAVVAAVHLSSSYVPAPLTYVSLALNFAIWSLLIVITVYDLRTKLIPDRFSYSFAVLALVTSLLTSHFSLLTLLAGPLLFLPFYLLWKLSDGRLMGLGDGKLSVGIGWYLGLSGGASAIMYGFWIGAAVSLLIIGFQHLLVRLYPLLGTHGLSLRSEIPFGPFLVAGIVLVAFFQLDLFRIIL